MRIDILTIFPDVFRGVLAESMLRLARERGKAAYHLTDLRDSTTDRHRSVDDRPFGGGPGMVFKVEPVVEGVREIEKRGREALGLGSDARPVRILTSPQGERFTQAVADELSKENWLLFIAGHYEGYDERIRTILQPRELSIGDYVLTGGELAAMVMIDSVVRLLPGVLGADDAQEFESFSAAHENGGCLLEYPQYTRPVEFEGHRVPEVLKCGDHARSAAWRRAQAVKRTHERRPDLLGGGTATPLTAKAPRAPRTTMPNDGSIG